MSILVTLAQQPVELVPAGCRACGGAVADRMALCGSCWDQLETDWARLPELRADLENRLAGWGRTGSRVPVRHVGGQAGGLVVDRRASDALAALERHVRRWGGLVGAGRLTVATSDWAGQVVAETRQMLARGVRAIDVRDARQYLGVCSAVVVEASGSDPAQLCERDLYVPADAVWVRCPECWAAHCVPRRRAALLDAVGAVRVSAAEASTALPKVFVGWRLPDGSLRQVDYLPAWSNVEGVEGGTQAVFVQVTASQVRAYAHRGSLVGSEGRYRVDDVVRAVRAAWCRRNDIPVR